MSIDGGSSLMTLVRDFILINMHINHPSYDYMLYDSAMLTEGMAILCHTTILKIFESLHIKGMTLLPIGCDRLSSETIGLSDEDGLECSQNLSSAAVEFL
jgi:hypothetical protein